MNKVLIASLIFACLLGIFISGRWLTPSTAQETGREEKCMYPDILKIEVGGTVLSVEKKLLQRTYPIDVMKAAICGIKEEAPPEAYSLTLSLMRNPLRSYLSVSTLAFSPDVRTYEYLERVLRKDKKEIDDFILESGFYFLKDWKDEQGIQYDVYVATDKALTSPDGHPLVFWCDGSGCTVSIVVDGLKYSIRDIKSSRGAPQEKWKENYVVFRSYIEGMAAESK